MNSVCVEKQINFLKNLNIYLLTVFHFFFVLKLFNFLYSKCVRNEMKNSFREMEQERKFQSAGQ